MAEKSLDLFVFKQTFKSKNLPSTRILNQKHLIYIATRPGVARNPECGFGLWGKLPGMKASENINDLRAARRIIGEASEKHTLYRAVLSVKQKTAKEYGLYDRATWQKLINTRISVIQREMHIKPENFRWAASMHYKKGHPHTHLIYWDAGKEPRAEVIPKERFEVMSERIRTTFSRVLCFEKELHTAQSEQAETVKSARLQLAAMLKEANLPDALDLDHVKPAELDELGKGLLELAHTLPPTGRLKYGLLMQEYRQKLDEWLERVMQITDFAKLERRYLELSCEVTRLYGNDEAAAEKFQQQAHDRFFTELGNETLAYLKEVVLQLQSHEPPGDIQELCTATRHMAQQILLSSPAFRQLLASMPKWQTPNHEILKDDALKKQISTIIRDLTSDLRIRAKAEGYIAAVQSKCGAEKGMKGDVYKNLHRAMNSIVMETARQEMGYDAQAGQGLAVMGLLRLFSSCSQGKNQLCSQRDLQHERYRNLSKEAKQDLQKKRQQEGSWHLEP